MTWGKSCLTSLVFENRVSEGYLQICGFTYELLRNRIPNLVIPIFLICITSSPYYNRFSYIYTPISSPYRYLVGTYAEKFMTLWKFMEIRFYELQYSGMFSCWSHRRYLSRLNGEFPTR